MAAQSTSPEVFKRTLHFLDVVEEKNQRLPPIQGHEDKPLVSLEEAVEPVISFVPKLRQMVSYAKQGRIISTSDLSSEESASIRLYTMEWEPREKSFFYILNQTLRSEDRNKLRPWFLYLKLILTALGHLSSISCKIYRGVKHDLSRNYIEGTTFTWWGFSSCTSSANVLETDQFLGTRGERTVFIIHCKTGKDIREISFYRNEFEVLLLPATKFRVIKCRKSLDLCTIELEELACDIIMEAETADLLSAHSDDGYSNSVLENYINKCKAQSQIVLHQMQLHDEDMNIVVQLALNEKQCTELHLSQNRQITSQGVSIITTALQTNNTLVYLYLSNNPKISDDSARILAKSLEINCTLKLLDLSQNSIEDSGAECLAEMLTINKTLIDLDLTNNRIRNAGVRKLAAALDQSNSTLEKLSLHWNPYADGCINALMEMLQHNQSLKYLGVLNSSTLSIEAKARLKDTGKQRLQ